MKITNKYGLPRTLVNAASNDSYSMGDARISVTGLLRPPRIALLNKKHAPDIETDVTDHIYSLMGKAVHKILEDGGDEEHLTEERLFAEVRGWRVSGQLDLQRLPHIGTNVIKITDYKNTSAYAVMHEKPDWTSQLNTYAWLIREAKGMIVHSVDICAIVRDWSRHKADESADYPVAPVVMVPIPLWSPDEAAAFVDGRVRLHQESQALWDMGEEPPPCTDEERWMRPSTWAVKKKGNKRPTRMFTNEPDAIKYSTSMGAEYFIDHREGEPIRCSQNYCNVAGWCKQYSAYLDSKE